MQKVRQALGHSSGTPTPPAPPEIPDSIARMVRADLNLADVFAKCAKEQKILLTRTSADAVAGDLVAWIPTQPIKSVALSVSPLLDRLGIQAALPKAGVSADRWDEITLDSMYDFDCAVTDVQCAVAENATLVIRPSASQGRSMSLVPMFHVAIVEKNQLIPDMIDLFAAMANDPDRSNAILITGPSKTADIEMNVVTGVHGPNVVKVYLIE